MFGESQREARNPKPWERLLPSIVALIIIATAAPMVAGWVPPNRWYGFRTAATMSSPEAWHQANALMGWYMIVGQLVATVSVRRVGKRLCEALGRDELTWQHMWVCAIAVASIGLAALHWYATT